MDTGLSQNQYNMYILLVYADELHPECIEQA